MPSSIMYSCREVSELLFERGILRKFLMMLLAAVGLLICSVRSEARDAYVRLAAGGTFVVEGAGNAEGNEGNPQAVIVQQRNERKDQNEKDQERCDR